MYRQAANLPAEPAAAADNFKPISACGKKKSNRFVWAIVRSALRDLLHAAGYRVFFTKHNQRSTLVCGTSE